MGRHGGEIGELFRRQSDETQRRAWWSRKPDAPTEEAPAPRKAEPPKPKKAPRSRDTTTPPGRVVLTFSREAVAITAAVVTGVLMAAFVFGYKSGVHRAQAIAPTPRPDTRVAENPNATGGTKSYVQQLLGGRDARKAYTLRLLPSCDLQQQHARSLAERLRADGIRAFASRPAGKRGYTVNVEVLGSRTSREADEMARRFSSMPLSLSAQGTPVRYFEGCHWTTLAEAGEY